MATVQRKVKGGRFGSDKAVKQSAKKTSGIHPKVKMIPAESEITVRFIEEPPDWFGYWEYWDDESQTYIPVIEGETPEGKPSFRYLANAYVIDDAKVMAVKMPKSLVELLIKYYDKYGTMLDRDYDLSRTGSGQNDTKYLPAPSGPKKMNLSRFKPIDIDQILVDMASGSASDDDDDEDEDDDAPRTRRGIKGSRRAPVVDDDEDEDDDNPWDDDEDEEEDDEPVARRPVRRPVKKSVVRKPVRKPIRRTR